MTLEKSLNYVDHLILGVKYGKLAPLVEGQTRMCNVERYQISDAKVIVLCNFHIGVLIHELCKRPVGRSRLGSFFSVPEVSAGTGSPASKAASRLTASFQTQ